MTFAHIRAVLFDKDGTLFDFAASWSNWATSLLNELSEADPARARRMADSIGFDLAAGRFDPSSPVIAGTLDEAAELLHPHLPDLSFDGLVARLIDSATRARMVPPVPLDPLLAGLRGQGHVLGVATNDSETAALAHLKAAGIAPHFAHVLGYDSGYTPKPAPDMLLGFATLVALPPKAVVMVGDSTHDLIAGRAAGMATIGVLTGLARAEDLAPHADLVLPDIGHLPQVLGGAG